MRFILIFLFLVVPVYCNSKRPCYINKMKYTKYSNLKNGSWLNSGDTSLVTCDDWSQSLFRYKDALHRIQLGQRAKNMTIYCSDGAISYSFQPLLGGRIDWVSVRPRGRLTYSVIFHCKLPTLHGVNLKTKFCMSR